MEIRDVDAIVIGAGQAGVPLALDWAKAGKRVVLFERARLGGTCVNTGCTPSKTFLASAHNAGRARDAKRLHVHCEVRVDGPAVMRRVNEIRGEWNGGVEKKVAGSSVELVRAEARFTDVRTVTGGDVSVRAPIVVIDTGSSPAIPPIDGLSGVKYLTNETFFDQTDIPKRLIVIGGGYVGLELAQGSARLGAHVTVIETSPRLMPREDLDATEVIAQALRDDGVDLRIGSKVSSVAHAGTFSVTIEGGGEIEADAILVAAGRTPNSKALDCARSGIEVDERGTVKTDEHLRTTCEGVYAVGEAAGQPAFTHVAWEDYRRVKATVAGETRTKNDRVLAYCTFTEPQLARAGFTASEAEKHGHAVRVETLQLEDDARGTEWALQRGFYRIVVDAKTDAILGATLVGYEAGEIVHTILAHMQAGSSWRVLERSVHIHPTFSEALPTLVRRFV